MGKQGRGCDRTPAQPVRNPTNQKSAEREFRQPRRQRRAEITDKRDDNTELDRAIDKQHRDFSRINASKPY